MKGYEERGKQMWLLQKTKDEFAIAGHAAQIINIGYVCDSSPIIPFMKLRLCTKLTPCTKIRVAAQKLPLGELWPTSRVLIWLAKLLPGERVMRAASCAISPKSVVFDHETEKANGLVVVDAGRLCP